MAHAISNKTIEALLKGKAPDGASFDQYGRCEIIDAHTPGFGVRLGKRGVTFLAFARFGDSKHPVRRVIGRYGKATNRGAGIFTLADARAEVERWRNEASEGKDPREEIKRVERVRQRDRGNTFEKVAEEFIASQLIHTRKGEEVANDIRREFVSLWGNRPIAEIETDEITAAV